MRLATAAAAGALAVLLAACAAAGADPWRVERDRAAEIAARIELEWPLEGSSGPVPSFVRELGARLGDAVDDAPYPWRFTVVRDRSANAFVIGGGRIYVTEGTVTICESEAEVAAILAHEMGHELAGHLRPRASSWPGPREALAEDVPIGSVVQSLDLDKELEADRLSLGILRRAGYDPASALTVARRLARGGERARRHFGDERRIAALEKLLEGERRGGAGDSEAFRAAKRSLAGR